VLEDELNTGRRGGGCGDARRSADDQLAEAMALAGWAAARSTIVNGKDAMAEANDTIPKARSTS
jgi:hypothetical protein